MVKFDLTPDKTATFNVTVTGNEDEYIETIKSLLQVMYSVPVEMHTNDSIFYLCNLIDNMLPSPEQIISIEDARELKRIKSQNSSMASDFIRNEKESLNPK